MRIIAVKALMEFWTAHSDSKQHLRAWYDETRKADWPTPAVIKAQYRSAGILGNGRVAFNIKGNDYRLVVRINYKYRIVSIRFVMEQAGLTRNDLERYIGPRSRVSEVLNRRRRLTLRMAWRLHIGLGIPAESLSSPYELDRA